MNLVLLYMVFINCFSATKKIKKRVEEKICVWEQTRNRLKDGIEALTVQFKKDCESLEIAALKLDEIMTGKPDLSQVQLGRLRLLECNGFTYLKPSRGFKNLLLFKYMPFEDYPPHRFSQFLLF